MEKNGKKILSLLCAAVMLLSFVAIPGFGAQKAEAAGAADELDAMEAAGHIYANYTAANFDASTGTVAADDEAYTKNAISSTVKDLTGAGKFVLYRYCANADADKQYYKIAELSADALKLNQGYQVYKFSVDVPATGMGTGGVTYFFDDNWEMVHNSMGTVISSFAGKKVDLFLSMKITGEATAATVYIDRLAVVDPCDNYVDEDGVCTKCGKVVMNKAEIELNEKNATGHVYANYVPSTFDGAETFVTDPDAYSAQSAIQAGPFNLSINGFGFYAYSGSNGDLKLDEIAPEELLINQGYQIYKLSAKITDSLADSACTYYRSDAGAWKFVNFNGGTVVKAFVGKQLDIYISLKIEGSLENATCYVDRLAFVDPCENYAGEDGKCTKCGKELPLPASHELFDYNANNFTGTSETDAEAYKEIAKSYSGKDLTAGAAVKIHRYDTGASDVSIQYMKLGELAAANIKNNQGYQTYEFTTTIPAEGMTDSSPFVYFLDDWSFQNAQMAKDLKTLAGKTVTISLSMKVVGELSNATVYIDRVQILSVCEDYLNEDGTQCRVCGKSMLDESLPEELQRLDENHLFRYNTSNFAVNADSGESIVADADSLLGSAFYCENLNIGSKIELYRYDNAAAADQQYVFIGAIAAADVKLNQGYQFYKFTVDLPAEGMANGNFVYVDYAGWKCLNATMAHDMKTLAGKTVDVYLSLKVVGSDTANTVCYIDQMIMVDSCSYEAVVTAPTCTEAGYTTYTCPICGDSYVADQTAAKGHTEVVDAAAAPTCTETGLTEGKHCSACGEVLVVQEVVPALDHSYGDWNVTEPTYTAAGSQSKTCSRCGDVVTEEIPVLANPVSTWNIALGDNIGVNFVMALTDTDVVDVTVNGNAVACTIADGKISIYVAAAQMMDEIAISVNGMPLANTYSVRRYADAILADASQSDCHELVKNMLNYGAASQSYFGYNSDHLANDGIAVEAATVPAEGGEVTVSGEAQGIRFYGASLVHENKIAVRFYFAGSIEGIDFGAYTVNQKNGMYYIEVADIVPQNLENDIVVSVSDGANTLTVAYAPVDYIIRMYNKIDAAENTRALVQALYGYYLAAEAYTAA